MANEITRRDVLAIYGDLAKAGEEWTDYPDMPSSIRLKRDGLKIMVSGWPHGDIGWSRGYTISTFNTDLAGYIEPEDRDARYSGRGWKQRMVADILRDIEGLRAGPAVAACVE